MQIQTTRFGAVTVDPDHIMTFPQGLIGFGEQVRFALLGGDNQGPFYWLQATDDAEVAFLVVDPALFFKDYHVSIREETQEDLNLADAKDGQVLVVCNRVGEWLTGNLLGPLVINTRTRIGQQIVLTEKTWTCRQPLIRMQSSEVPTLARAA
ncbi:MAG: flagellar assembly protein FliW [Tepidisphaeraceae bacterium]